MNTLILTAIIENDFDELVSAINSVLSTYKCITTSNEQYADTKIIIVTNDSKSMGSNDDCEKLDNADIVSNIEGTEEPIALVIDLEIPTDVPVEVTADSELVTELETGTICIKSLDSTFSIPFVINNDIAISELHVEDATFGNDSVSFTYNGTKFKFPLEPYSVDQEVSIPVIRIVCSNTPTCDNIFPLFVTVISDSKEPNLVISSTEAGFVRDNS